MNRLQTTLKREVTCEGIGLHTGAESRLRLLPAPRDTGIIFYRTDKGSLITANLAEVSDTAFATTLGTNGSRVRTVEHLLAALSGMGIDNVIVQLDGPEIPIMDGSSESFVSLIRKVGVARQASMRPYMRITKPFYFESGSAEFFVEPFEGRMVTYHLEYKHPLLGKQSISLELKNGTFEKEVAPARTFGFLKDVQLLWANGLAKGGSLENAVILGEDGILNETGLRFENEFIRHKILDLIGDLSLIGFPVFGHITASRTGHASNLKFAKHILTNCADSWEIVSESDVRKHQAIYS